MMALVLVLLADRSEVSARYRCPIYVWRVSRATPPLHPQLTKQGKGKGITHASSNDLIAFLMPSAPSASVPYGSLDEPEMLLSSDTRSDSSLYTTTKGKGRSRKG